MELLFLSFSTLSSTGIGDVVPVKPFARGLVMFEMIAGVAYLTVVVSRLVALTVMRPSVCADRRRAARSPQPRRAQRCLPRSGAAGGAGGLDRQA